MAFLTKQTEYFKTSSEPFVTAVGARGYIVDNVASGFSADTDIVTQDQFAPEEGQQWEIQLKIKTAASVAGTQQLIGGYATGTAAGLEFGIKDGKWIWWIGTGTSYNIANGVVGTYAVQPNTDYWVKVAYDGEYVRLSYSTDSEYFTQDLQVALAAPINAEQKTFGCDSYSNASYFQGSIDFNETYINIEGSRFWDIHHPYIAEGFWVIEGVATGFSTSRYLQVPWSFNAAAQNATWEVVGKFKLSALGVRSAIFGGASGTYIMDVNIGTNNKFILNMSSNGSSYNIANSLVGEYTFEADIDYWCKLSFDGFKYVLSYSLDGIRYIEDIVVESDLRLELTYDRLCIGFRVDHYLRGEIDLKECYIKIDGAYWWLGTRTEVVPAKTITDFAGIRHFRDELRTNYWKWGSAADATIYGAIGQIYDNTARGFSSSSYYQIPSFSSGSITEAQIVFTTGYDVSSTQGLFFAGVNDNQSSFIIDAREIKLNNKNSGSYRSPVSMGLVVLPNTKYFFKFEQSGSTITPYLSTDGVKYIKGTTVSRSRDFRNNIGYGLDNDSTNHPFYGSVELADETYIKINGELWFTGFDAVQVGSWITSGNARGFSAGKYLMLPKKFDVSQGQTWEMMFKVNLANRNYQYFLGNAQSGTNYGALNFHVGGYGNGDGRLRVMLSSSLSGSVPDIIPSTAGSTVLSINTDYWIKVEFTGSVYNVYLSTTGEFNGEETLEITANSTKTIYPVDVILGAYNRGEITWSGLIDLNQSYIKIDNEIWWHGTKAIEGTPTDYVYTTEEEVAVQVPDGEPYDYELYVPSTQYTYSQTRNIGNELTRRKSFYYAYTDELETLRTGNWGRMTPEGEASGFHSSGWLTIPSPFSPMDKSWEMVTKFKINSLGVLRYLYCSTSAYQSIGIRITTGNILEMSGYVNDTSTYAFQLAGTNPLEANVDYFLKAKYTPEVGYELLISTDGEEYSTVATSASTTLITSGQIVALGADFTTGGAYQQGAFTDGTIYLADSYINIDGERWWDWKTDVIPDGYRMWDLSWGRDGIISTRNVSNNCLLLPEAAQPTGINWEVQVKVTTSSDVSTEQCLIGDWILYDGFLLQIISGKMALWASSNGTSWDIANDIRSATAVLANTTYYVKMSYDGVKYSIDVSTDGAIYDNFITVETDKLMYKGRYVACARYGGDRAFVGAFKGTMDLNESYMIIGDDIVWSGMKSLITPDYSFDFIGSWIKEDVDNSHIIGGTSTASNYMRSSRPVFSTYEKDIEVCMKVMMDANPISAGEIQYVMAPNYSTFLWGFNTDGRIARYNNSAWAYGATYYMPGDWIWLKVKWDGANYYTYTLKDDGYTKDTLPDVGEWVLDNTFASTTNIFSGYNLFLGWDDNKAARYFRGYIDYSESYVKVDGKEIWTGTSIREIPETEVTVDIEYYKEIRHQVDTLTYACYSTNDRYVYAKAPVGGYDTVYCYRGNDMSVQTTDASLLASSGYTFTGLTEDLATFDLVGNYSLPRYPDGDIYRTAISIETVPGTPDDYTYTKISENFGFTETRRVAAPLINVAATKRYYFRVILETDTPGEYSFTIPEDSEYTRVTIVGGGGACALRGVYDDRGYGWGGGSAGAYDGEFALTPGEYTATVASANNNAKPQGGNTNTLNPDDMTTHDSWIDGVVRIGGGGCGHYSPNYVGAAGASATFDIQPQNSRLNTVGRVGVYGSGGKGSSPSAYCAGGDSVYNGYGKGQGGYASEYANGRRWVNGTGGYLKVVSASLSPDGGYDYFEDILKG